MSTAESVLRSVLQRLNLRYSNPQISSTDSALQQVVEMINAAGVDIAARADWPLLFKAQALTPGGTSAPLPDDFSRLVEGGAVRLTAAPFTPIRVVVSPAQWAFLAVNASAQPYCHLSGGYINFAPTLGNVTLRYVSKYWTDAGEAVAQNGDNILIPARVLISGAAYRWLRQKGLPYDDVMAEHEADLAEAAAASRGAE